MLWVFRIYGAINFLSYFKEKRMKKCQRKDVRYVFQLWYTWVNIGGRKKCIIPKGTNQKFKLYLLAQIMQEKTGDEYYITRPIWKKCDADSGRWEHFTVNVDVYVSRQFLVWAGQKLYLKGNFREVFYNILEKNMMPVYDAARRQEYEIWNYG